MFLIFYYFHIKHRSQILILTTFKLKQYYSMLKYRTSTVIFQKNTDQLLALMTITLKQFKQQILHFCIVAEAKIC